MSVYLVCDEHGRRPARDLHLRRCLLCHPTRVGPIPVIPPAEHAEIRRRVQAGETLRAVAASYRVTKQRIHQIARHGSRHG